MSLKINNDTANGSVTLQASNTATGDVVATLPPFSTELAPRMQLMTAKTASGTSVDFTGIPSWAKKITIMFNGVSTNGSSPVQVQLGSNSLVEVTGYSCAQTGGSTGIGSSVSTTGLRVDNGPGSAFTRAGTIVVMVVSNFSYVMSGSIADTTTAVFNQSNGSKTLSNTLDRIRITTISGTDTFDAGTINILVEG